MSGSSTRIRASWGFYGLGSLWIGLAVWQSVSGDGLSIVLKTFTITVLAGIIGYVGYDLPTYGLSRRGERRVLKQTYLATLAFVLLATAILLVLGIERPGRQDWTFVLPVAGALGGAVGGRASLYDVRSQEELERNRDLTKLLKVNQRVLRHNLRNELAIVLGQVENLDARIGPTDETDEIRAHLRNLLDLSSRARRIVSIWETDTRVEFSVRTLVTECVRRFRTEYPDTPVSIAIDEDHDVVAHPALQLAIDEALENAVVHTGPDVEVTVSSHRGRDGYVVIEIADTGSGLESGETHALFQPAETPLEHSQGLGLWLIYWAVTAAGGTLDFSRNDPEGTVVELRLLPATGSSSLRPSIGDL